MSYRNPQIIVDRSAEIYAKMATAGSDAFNQYMKYRSVAAEKAMKQEERIVSVLNKAEESAQSRIDKGIEESKIKDPSLIEQTQELLGTYLDEGNVGFLEGKPSVLDMQVAVEIGSVKGKTRREYKKAIQQYKAFENKTIDTAGAYQVQLEEGKNINSSTIQEGYTIAGVGSQKFINLASYLTLKNQEADGVSITRKTEDDGSIVINGTIDTNGEGYKRYVEAGLIDPTDGELTYNDENNTASFTWKSLSSNPARELVLKRLKGFDSQEASINAGLENEKGDLSKRLYTGERSSRVEKFPNDPSREQDVTKLYIDPSVIENNVAFRGDAQGFAEQVRVSPAHQRDDYILRTHGKEILEEFKNADFAKQDDIIYRELMLRNLERLTGVGEGSGLIKKEGDKYYIEEYGTPRNVTEDGLTATERREAKELKDSQSRFKRAESLIKQEDKLPEIPTNPFNPTSAITDEGKRFRAAVSPRITDSGGKLVKFVVSEVTGEPSVIVKYPGVDEKEISLANFRNPSLLTAKFEEATGAGTGLIDQYFGINID